MEKSEFYPGLLKAAQRDDLAAAVRDGAGDPVLLARHLRRFIATATDTSGVEQLRPAVAASVLLDLVQQGWSVSSDGEKIHTVPPDVAYASAEGPNEIKARIREGLQRSSNRQLASPAVRQFIRSLQRPREFAGRTVSISTLVDDGAELAAELLAATQGGNSLEIEWRLGQIFRPRVQVCGPNARCEFTGIPLLDVWRYFRHTWSLEYNSVPGRTLRFLIRNDGRPNSPVIGIAMVASPAANLYSRDGWIGWRLEDLTRNVANGSIDAGDVAKVLLSVVDEAIGDIRSDDLLNAAELASPTDNVLFRLGQTAAKAEVRRRTDLSGSSEERGSHLVDIRSLDKNDLTEEDWKQLSETALFTKKRAEQLVPLLQARRHFHKAGFRKAGKAAVYESLVSPAGRAAIGTALSELRKRKLATEVADISVCGAVSPYNHLLGGKLVALLMASDEVRRAYRDRYTGQVSEIASQLAGRPIVRSADLKVITTTSLYGVGSSQYNRLRLPAYDDLALRLPVLWQELPPSVGVTVTHLSKSTVELMRRLGVAVYGRRRINSVFGEGSSPRTRQIREGLNLIGINDDRVLKHAVGRKVYACELYQDARDDLTGFRRRKGTARSMTERAISAGWIRRWLLNRAGRQEVVESVKSCPRSIIADELESRALRSAAEDEGGELNDMFSDDHRVSPQ